MSRTLACALGLVLGYASHVAFNSDAFSDRVAASLEQPGVAALIADRVTGAAESSGARLSINSWPLSSAGLAIWAVFPERPFWATALSH